jgi:aminoglycoside phosphotransferase (APT) family kinase protein
MSTDSTYKAAKASRLARVCAAAGLSPQTQPEAIESYSNDTWILDLPSCPAILRIGYSGDVTRLLREVAVTQDLPPEFPYPQLLDSGATDLDDLPLAWMLTRRLPEGPLDEVWTTLPARSRDRVIDELAAALEVLHAHAPTPEVARAVCERPTLDLTTVDGITGADVNPFPLARLAALLPYARATPFVDPGLIDATTALILELADLAPCLDDPATGVLVHGDVHLANILATADGHITALLDLEWVRLGPRWLELERLCQQADESARGTGDGGGGGNTYRPIIEGLLRRYPQVADVDRLGDRLRLVSLGHALRHLVVWPPDAPEASLRPEHPVHRLRALVNGTWPLPGALPRNLLG